MRSNQLVYGALLALFALGPVTAEDHGWELTAFGGGHFSGRLTVCLVAIGVIAKKLLKDISVKSTILEIGGEQDLEKGLQKAIDVKDSKFINSVSQGWPGILSSLKSLLETGESLEETRHWPKGV